MKGKYSAIAAAKFYWPLFVQAFSQCLTYPLVASIAGAGSLGVKGYTAYAQGLSLMFMLGAIAGGLPMTGMVFSRTRAGYAAFQRLNRLMMAALLSLEVLIGLKPVGPWIFANILNLPAELTDVACDIVIWGAVMQAGFFLRNEPFVLLMNERRSFEANLATLIRVAVTAAMPLVFLPLGWIGPIAALVAQTIPVWLETVFTWYFARSIPGSLDPNDDAEITSYYSVARQFSFTMPLSIGYLLLATSPIVLSMAIARTEDAVMMLSVHAITVGVFNPFGFGALRMQAVQIQFPREYPGDRRLVAFAALVGIVLGLLVAILAMPGLSDWYFCGVQNLPREYLGKARIVMAIFAFLPIVQSLRGRAEGIAALKKKPRIVMRGQIAFLAVMIAALLVMLVSGVPGWIMGAVAFTAAIWSCTLVIALGIRT